MGNCQTPPPNIVEKIAFIQWRNGVLHYRSWSRVRQTSTVWTKTFKHRCMWRAPIISARLSSIFWAKVPTSKELTKTVSPRFWWLHTKVDPNHWGSYLSKLIYFSKVWKAFSLMIFFNQRHGASITVLDKEDKSAIYLASDQNNVDCLMV